VILCGARQKKLRKTPWIFITKANIIRFFNFAAISDLMVARTVFNSININRRIVVLAPDGFLPGYSQLKNAESENIVAGCENLDVLKSLAGK